MRLSLHLVKYLDSKSSKKVFSGDIYTIDIALNLVRKGKNEYPKTPTREI